MYSVLFELKIVAAFVLTIYLLSAFGVAWVAQCLYNKKLVPPHKVIIGATVLGALVIYLDLLFIS